MVEEIYWHGIRAVKLDAGGYEAVLVPEIGANLIRLYNKDKGVDILRTPTVDQMETFVQRPQVFGMPLLFPPNRIENGKYTYNGKSYQYPITIPTQNNYHHGVIKSQQFTVTDMGEADSYTYVEATFVSNRLNNAIYRHFPHEFECKMSFRLSEQGLEHTVTFVNLSDEPMPLGIGYHTPIMVPFMSNGKREDYRLRLSVGEIWELNERSLPTENLLPLDAQTSQLRSPEGMQPTGTPIEVAFTANPIDVDGETYHGAIVTDRNSGISVYYEVDDQVKHWTFWNNGGEQNWACPEPQTWATNAPNLKLHNPAVTGLQSVAPGDSWSTTCKLYVK